MIEATEVINMLLTSHIISNEVMSLSYQVITGQKATTLKEQSWWIL